MEVSSRTQKLMSFVIILELDINSQPSILHNQMTLLRERIEHLLIWQGPCLVSTMWVNLFGSKLSTRLAIVATASIVTDWKRRHHMSSWLVESSILHIFGFLVANAISWRKGTRLDKFDKKCDEGFLLGYSTTSKAYRFGIWIVVLLRKFMMLNLMKPRVHK